MVTMATKKSFLRRTGPVGPLVQRPLVPVLPARGRKSLACEIFGAAILKRRGLCRIVRIDEATKYPSTL